MIYLGSTKNCNSATIESCTQVSTEQGENSFTEEKGSWERYSKQRVHGLSLVGFLPGKKRRLLMLKGMKTPLYHLPTLCN